MPEMDACPQLFWVPDRYYPSLLAVGSSPLTLGAALATLSAQSCRSILTHAARRRSRRRSYRGAKMACECWIEFRTASQKDCRSRASVINVVRSRGESSSCTPIRHRVRLQIFASSKPGSLRLISAPKPASCSEVPIASRRRVARPPNQTVSVPSVARPWIATEVEDLPTRPIAVGSSKRWEVM